MESWHIGIFQIIDIGVRLPEIIGDLKELSIFISLSKVPGKKNHLYRKNGLNHDCQWHGDFWSTPMKWHTLCTYRNPPQTLGPKTNVNFFMVDPHFGVIFPWDSRKVPKMTLSVNFGHQWGHMVHHKFRHARKLSQGHLSHKWRNFIHHNNCLRQTQNVQITVHLLDICTWTFQHYDTALDHGNELLRSDE